MTSASANLNIFQRLVRHWDAIHPYNAGQMMCLRGRPDPAQWAGAWHDSLDVLGLGQTTVTGSRYRHELLNGTADLHAVVQLPAGTDFDTFITSEMNRPFDAATDCPFRPFILTRPDQNDYLVGVVYQHWVADSASIRTLLHDWFARVYDPQHARTSPLRAPRGGYLSVFSPVRADWHLGEGFLSSVRWSSRFRRVRRVEAKCFNDYRVKFSSHATPPGTIERVRVAARNLGVTVNDVFLAALAEVCDRRVPMTKKAKRQDLAIGTIVDLRPFVREDLSDVFGLFLGFTSVICRPAHFADFDTLLRSIATQTDLHRHHRAALASPIRMSAGLLAAKIMRDDPRKVASFYRKRLPMAGGISNVNLNRTWVAKYHPDPILDYVRISPTGPMMPLVLTPSTLGTTLSLGVTRRASVIDDNLTSRVVEDFVTRLSSL